MICRLYIDAPLQPGTQISLPPDQAHYLRTVMRLQPGDSIVLFNGTGGEYSATIDLLSKSDSSASIDQYVDISREMPIRVHIVQAACRSEKIELVLQKATELGAASFHIVRSERSSLKLDSGKLDKRIERWQKIVIEACEQSFRTKVPEVAWHNALTAAPSTGSCFCLHPEGHQSWASRRADILNSSDITLAIGPEGGWSPRDMTTLNSMGYQNLLFGPRVMRTETAAPALLAAIQALLD